MGQRSKYLASNDALIIPNEEDCAEGCRRHGARRNPHDESTTFVYIFPDNQPLPQSLPTNKIKVDILLEWGLDT
eukprot:scaffold10995_cov115-Skeletonema_marinoi.AAC.4